MQLYIQLTHQLYIAIFIQLFTCMQLILIVFAGLTIASIVRISDDKIESSYPDYDDYDGEDSVVGMAASGF